MDIVMILAAFVAAHPWALVVLAALLGLSEVLPYFPNIEANNVVQMVINTLKLLKAKLSLKAPVTTPTEPPAQQ